MASPQSLSVGPLENQTQEDLLGTLIKDSTGDLQKAFRAKGEEFAPIRSTLETFLRSTVRGYTQGRDVIQKLNYAISLLDKALNDQVNAVIHHEDFRKMEQAWRGLEYLVDNTPSSQTLKISVFNVSKEELAKNLERFKAESGQNGWDQSPIYRTVFGKGFDTPGGEPFGCLVGDYEFDQTPPDVDLMARLTRVCGAAHVPFISSASPRILGMDSWQTLMDPASLAARMATPDYASWNSLRQSEDARYMALTVPRFLARLPYGAKTNPVEGMAFEEDLRPVDDKGAPVAGGPEHNHYVWANSAYAMAVNIGRSFDDTGLCTRIRGQESGGAVTGLPVHSFTTSEGSIDTKCPTEIALTQQRESELSRLGFMPLMHEVGTDGAFFVGGQTIQKPAKYSTDQATENAALSARLPYVFMCSRFAHYLKKIIYRWVGSNKERAELEAELNSWIRKYTSDSSSADDIKCKQPLAEAKIVVEEIPGKPGYYNAKAFLRPHIQLEGVDVSLGVVSKVPGAS